LFEERFEVFGSTALETQEDFKLKSIEAFFSNFIPAFATHTSRREVNIFFLDLISSYKG
jgi:hypothetical protein